MRAMFALPHVYIFARRALYRPLPSEEISAAVMKSAVALGSLNIVSFLLSRA